jgi:hypothetical protein
VAKVDQAFKGNEERVLSYDYVHPNDLGYASLEVEDMSE